MNVHLKHNEQITNSRPPASALSDPVGIGLRPPYYQEVLENPPDIGWFEVHPENYFGGGKPQYFLSEVCKSYPLSLHGIGLSLGSDQPVDEDHLRRFKELIDIYQPFSVSDHASWSASGNAHLNDLLPLPYTQETLDTMARNVERTQEYFGRTILVENPSTYVAFADNAMPEYEFLDMLSERTGCDLLIDVNNIYVQQFNHGIDAHHYIDQINPSKVKEMHLAGHTEKEAGTRSILIDTHNRPVCSDVWKLYEHAVKRFGVVPTLIEWDQDYPPLNELVGQAHKARDVINSVLGTNFGAKDEAHHEA